MDEQDDGPDARAPDPGDLVRICEALNRNGARYVLIGGYAMILHGAGRATMDIDFLVDDDPANVARVKMALAVLADNAAAEVADDDVRAYTVVRVADEVIVDLLGKACDVDYADAIRDAESHDLGDVPVRLASKPTLIRTKRTWRDRDAADRRWLEDRIADETAEKPER